MPLAAKAEAATDRQPSRRVGDSWLAYAVFGLLLFGPLAFGAVEPWSIFVLETGAALLLVLWAWRQAASGELRIMGHPLFLPMLIFAGLIFLQLALRRSAYRHETLSAAFLYVAYGVICFLVVQCLRRSSQVKTLAVVLSAYGSAVALFALVQALSSNAKLYWVRTPRSGGWIYGPYVNHNHYAGLMEMLVPIPLVLSLTRHAHRRQRSAAALAAALMASTIFLSGSRGGMLAFAVQMVFLAALLIKPKKGPRTALAIAVFLVVVVGLLTWVGGGELTKRLASIHTETKAELSGGMRLDIDRDGMKMFAMKPVLGWGLGVFPVVYPQFRSFYTNFFVNAAHNDYVQLLVEMGSLGFVTMLWFVVVLYRAAWKKLGDWPNDLNGAVALASLLGSTGILVHSFLDFNLQIPANAALFYAWSVLAALEPRFALSRSHNRKTELMQASA